MAGAAFTAHEVDLHGHHSIYREAGSGPNLVLIHGMINSSRHWEEVAERLAGSYRVIAPDLIGHGDSATPRGDYSLGAHAASIRDLLAAIGVERATIVGHSLGGGVAMQFFYQFPQRTERLALISSGGLGDDVSPLLRAAALPGSGALLRLATRPRLVDGLAGAGEPAARPRQPQRRLPRGGRPGAAAARRRRLAPRLRRDPAGGDRRPRPAGQRPRPPLPAGRDADPDRLGRARPHDPGRARPRSRRGDPQLPLRDPPPRRPLPQPRRPRRASPPSSATGSTTTEPFLIDDADWGEHRRPREPPEALQTSGPHRAPKSLQRYSTLAIAASMSASEGLSWRVSLPFGPLGSAPGRCGCRAVRPVPPGFQALFHRAAFFDAFFVGLFPFGEVRVPRPRRRPIRGISASTPNFSASSWLRKKR